MTQEQKTRIKDLSQKGLNSREIAAQVGLSHMTVARLLKEEEKIVSRVNCLCCGKEIINKKGIKPKKFCSDKCRFKWWGKHRDLISHKSQSIKQCPHCGELFETERKTQVFCCRNCYLSEVTKR